MSRQLAPIPVRTNTDPDIDHHLLPLEVTPLVPEAVLRQHKVFVSTDQRFRSAARLLQALWREDRSLPIGTYTDGNDKRHKLGSRLTAPTGAMGANFMSPTMVEVVRRALIFREIGALYDVERLTTNLLSSMPLTFNLFAALKLDLDLASRFINALLPDTITEVLDVRFEHAPARGRRLFTGDYTAFDVLVRGYTATGQRAFIAVEVKYTETMHEPAPTEISARHFAIAAGAHLFHDAVGDEPALNPYQQLFREHCLAQSMLDAELYDVGWFMLVAPNDNHLVQNTATAYADLLNPARSAVVPFINATLESLVAAYGEVGEGELGRALYRRYLDFHLVAGEIELSAGPLPTGRASRRVRPNPAALPPTA